MTAKYYPSLDELLTRGVMPGHMEHLDVQRDADILLGLFEEEDWKALAAGFTDNKSERWRANLASSLFRIELEIARPYFVALLAYPEPAVAAAAIESLSIQLIGMGKVPFPEATIGHLEEWSTRLIDAGLDGTAQTAKFICARLVRST